MILIPARLSGQYQVTIHRSGIMRYQTPWFDNLVTDGGLNQVGNGSFLTHCYVGTGNTAPAVTDSGLASQLGSPTTTIISQAAGVASSSPWYGTRAITFRFAANTVVGNLSEVGVGWASALFSRSLIVDGNGDPTTVTVLDDETVDVTYLLKNYSPEDDYGFQATIGGTMHDCVVRACNASSSSTTSGWGITGSAIALASGTGIYPIIAYNGALGTIVQSPSGTSDSNSSNANVTYVNNSLEKGFSASWALANGNLAGGITAFRLATNGIGTYQISVSPAIAKTSSNILNVNFKVTWSRP